MSTLKVPVKITARADPNFAAREDVVRFLKNFDGGLLPDNVSETVYQSFIKSKDFADHKTLTFTNLFLRIHHGNENVAKLQRVMKRLRDELRRRFGVEILSISGKASFQVVWKANYRFECLKIDINARKFNRSEIEIRTKMIGQVNCRIVQAFSAPFYENARKILEKFGGGPREVDSAILADKPRQEAANFIFIRSLLDFINTAPSDSFSLAFSDIYQTYPFLFRPYDKFWDELLGEPEEKQSKILGALLLRARGLTRQTFETVIDWWVKMIVFLREKCDGDAGNFFKVITSKLEIDSKRNDALEVVQDFLEDYDAAKEYVGIAFPYSLKAGRLFLTMMTKNERGFDLMNDVRDDQVEELNLPVDSQVLRVALNTGLINVNWVNAENLTFSDRKAKVLHLKRSDMTELARVAWKLVAKNIGVPPIELDYLVYSIGSLLCNRFGKICYACPITDVCYSWAKRQIMEGNGADWNRMGMFSYGKGAFDALVFRPCPKCQGRLSDCRHKYPIEEFSDKESKIDLAKITS